MARNPEAPSKVDVLVLSSLARLPMHGYDIKLELRYKHVRWWAKAEHGHLYAALARLAKRGLIELADDTGRGRRARHVYAITSRGREHLERTLLDIGGSPDQTYFDVDLFLSGSFTLTRQQAIGALERRNEGLKAQLSAATALFTDMKDVVPLAGRLIMQHRREHLSREISFLEQVIGAFRLETRWGAMLGTEPISDFVKRTGAGLERSAPVPANSHQKPPKKLPKKRQKKRSV